MNSTPQKGFSVAAWNKIQRDLDSPSASCRLRAIQAINCPTNPNIYHNYDTYYDENSCSFNSEMERTIEKPSTIQEVMKDVKIYVEVRSGTENRTAGVKGAIQNLGATVTDRLTRNTTHVVFSEGLQSTYNKAKSWNIPIVSILWIEACKKHLILMDPKAYSISNIERYENPDLYEKTKRQKFIQPDTLMKNLHRPIPKSKILEEFKKQLNDVPDSSLSTSNGIVNSTVMSPNISQRVLTKKSILASGGETTVTKPNQSRKSLGKIKFCNEKPKNTIRSLFEKQLEKSRIESSQINSSSDAEADKTNNIDETLDLSKSKIDEKTNDANCLVTVGSLHKRLTRRNSITLQTPTKKPNIEEESSIMSSTKKRRCTMFTPSKPSIEEEEEGDDIQIDINKTIVRDDGIVNDGNKTVNKLIPMEICNFEPKNKETNKCNSRVRQLLNEELSKTPSNVKESTGNSNKILPMNSSSLRRRTTYTPHAMEETKVQNNFTGTPISLTQRRKTMNINSVSTTPLTAYNDTKHRDSDLQTKTNQKKDLNTSTFSTTPLINSLSKTHIDHIRSSTKKSLLEEYNSTFSSKKAILTSEKRKSIANITMDIIKQRIENINRNASFNKSMTSDLLDDSFHNRNGNGTPTLVENGEKITITPVSTEPTDGNIAGAAQTKPLKRRLFAPPSLFPPDNESHIPALTSQKTDKKTTALKRKRITLGASVEKPTTKLTQKNEYSKKTNVQNKTINLKRRSTMYFEKPETSIQKQNGLSDTASQSTSSTSSKMAVAATASEQNDASHLSALPGLVFTSMHKAQIDFITETVKRLGKFKLEDKVSVNTTHLISLDYNRRTVNILRGLIRGAWILNYDWVLKSAKANQWLCETEFEIRLFSKAVEINRVERQAFGRNYRMDIFRNVGAFYLTSSCTCKSLKELITLCYGKITRNIPEAHYIISERYEMKYISRDNKKSPQLHPNWILDSIRAGKVEKHQNYILQGNPS